jgi:hypothetical protein
MAPNDDRNDEYSVKTTRMRPKGKALIVSVGRLELPLEQCQGHSSIKNVLVVSAFIPFSNSCHGHRSRMLQLLDVVKQLGPGWKFLFANSAGKLHNVSHSIQQIYGWGHVLDLVCWPRLLDVLPSFLASTWLSPSSPLKLRPGSSH